MNRAIVSGGCRARQSLYWRMLPALAALAGEVLLDLVGELGDLLPRRLDRRVHLGDGGVDLFAGALVVGVVGDEAAERPGLAGGELADGDVDVERRLLHADQVVAGEAADRHQDAEGEEHLARRQVVAERHDRGVDRPRTRARTGM